MGMVVQHNMNAINAYNKLNANVAGMKKSSEKLSSGYRINRAGDDAAGLAVSEKMRSQIKGLNQAIRNSQDGINMIQTFEGAAQETHSILQRMKELASQSANGTYDNATDRAAMQLEFNQLNDELNQIADTDFNGTIVLNGGEMADGLKQVKGDFDYANKKDQLLLQAQEMAAEKTAVAKKSYEDAVTAFNKTNYDLTEGGTAPEYCSINENQYNKAEADALWADCGFVKTGTTDADTSVEKEITATYEFDGTTWNLKKAVSTSGKVLVGNVDETKDSTSAKTALAASAITAVTGATGEGGFKVGTAGKGLSNVIVDCTKVKKGDTATVVFTNSAPSKQAPNNVGWANDSIKLNDEANYGIDKEAMVWSVGAKDENMTQDVYDMYKALDGAKVTFTCGTADTMDGTFKIEYTDPDGTKKDVTLTAKGTGNADTKTFTIGETTFTAELKNDGTKLEIHNGKADADKVTYLTLTSDATKIQATDDAARTKLAVGDVITGTLNLEAYKYSEGLAPDIQPGDNKDLGTSKEAQALVDKAEAAYVEAQKAQASISDFETAKKYLTDHDVSVADAFDNSTARLLYTENITLQTGARSKDAVNFTFKYNQDNSVDMRGLEANLDISARANGLNTENLNIATADNANYAMDQIDKAINKVSMVRANFGAMQNRLEHKITNLTTTTENLTEAESSIRDTDMASEMMNYTKFNILQQAAQSMLAQANQQPQSILQLLG